MKYIRYISAILLSMLLCAGTATAQKYAYEVTVGSRNINVDLLDLPGSTPLLDVLSFLPEFIDNADLIQALGQYDIMVEGISVDCAANSVLKHLHLSDLKSISISESPSASQQKNSSGGVINLTLKDVEDGFSGRASLDLSSLSEIQPSAMLNYHKDKLTVRSWLMFDSYTPAAQNEYRTITTGSGSIYAIDTVGLKRYSQMARIYADYAASAKDNFQFRVWESTSSSDTYKYMKMIPTGESDAGGSNSSDANTFSATAAYSHSFSKGQDFSAEVDYVSMPSYGNDLRRNPLNINGDPGRKVESLSHASQIDGMISFGFPVIKSGDETRLQMRIGSNISLKDGEDVYTEKVNLDARNVNGIPSQIEGDVQTTFLESSVFVSPYIELGGGWTNLKYKANIKYQYFKDYVDANDVTGNFSLGWQMAPHHHLRFVYDRSVIRPSSWKTVPFLIYRPDQASYIMGNVELLSSKLNSFDFNYVTDFEMKKSTFFVNASLGLIHADGLVNTVHDFININSLVPYVTYENSGTSDILKANILCCFRSGPLMLTFSSNYFDKLQTVKEAKDHNAYYNLCFGSVYKITDKWTMSAEMNYNRPVSRPTVVYSPAFNGNLRVSKVWDKLESYIAVTDILHKPRREVTKSTDLTTYRYYDLYETSVILGLSYRF